MVSGVPHLVIYPMRRNDPSCHGDTLWPLRLPFEHPLKFATKVFSEGWFWVVFSQVAAWGLFVHISKQQWSAEGVVGGAFYVVTTLILARLIVQQAMDASVSLRHVAASALYLLSLILVDSALLYYSSGTTRNWNQNLSHFDALFVSVGTLTTAGTSGISARSTLAHALLTGQMLVDFLAVTLVVGAALQRLTPRAPAGEKR